MPWYLAMAIFYDMRSQLPFVITAGVVCHLFLGVTPVTSQALPAPADAGQTAGQNGCHLVLTSPPTVNAAGSPRKDRKPAGTKPKAVISEEQPAEITAHECEKACDVYTLRGAVEVKFETYIFHGD